MNCSAAYRLTAALVLLGLMMLLSTGNVHASESTPSVDIESIRILAERGAASAQNELGKAYFIGNGVAKSYSEAVDWHRKAADQGHAEAQYNLGKLYMHGKGVDYNHSAAVGWYRKAADQGHAEAQYEIGSQNWRTNFPESAKWHSKAAEQGHVHAQFLLGYLYFEGYGVDQEYSEAAYWYRRAAEQGSKYAQLELGNLYANGDGVDQDYSEAAYWYRKAADPGRNPDRAYITSGLARMVSASAKLELGKLYYNGDGVPRDAAKAWAWYALAADLGNEGAVSKRDSVYSELSSEQSKQALALVQALKARFRH